MPIAHTLVPALQRLFNDLTGELTVLDDQELRRRLISIDRIDGPRVQIGDREVISWCSNDYLGLATHPRLAEAAAQAAAEWGVGARASRLLAGSTCWHTRLEAALAAWFGSEAAIVYPSGYQANLGTLGALCSSRDMIFVDRLAHASLVDAARATRATLRVFRHNDPAHVAELLSRAGGARRRFIVTEGVFSMEGDRAPLAELAELAESHDAIVYVDDAHGAFVVGETGRGAPEAAGLLQARFLYMGTLGKALGCQGGFVVGPTPLIEFLRNRARTFIYTTALAVPVAAAADAALGLLVEEPERRATLHQRAARLHHRLAPPPVSGPPSADPSTRRSPLWPRRMAGQTGGGASHIVPIVVGETREALRVAKVLWDRGCWAPAIRPPTVPEGTARVRLNITALHTDAHIEQLTDALSAAL